MRNQVLGVGNHNGCRLSAYTLPALRLQLTHEGAVEVGSAIAVAAGACFGGECNFE